MKKALVIGCGLTGSVIARELAQKGFEVTILEKRSHVGGNMYDYIDEHGIIIHKYGPHTFHTNKKELYDYICKFEDWNEFILQCGAEINGITTPTPFNYQTIDDFFDINEAKLIKSEIKKVFPDKESVSVVEALKCNNDKIVKYANFLFENDYSLYTAKQWGCKPSEIDPSILSRVPLRFGYKEGYFDDQYQVMPKKSYSLFFENILKHDNITVKLNVNALEHIKVYDSKIYINGGVVDYPVFFTGPIDELFGFEYGKLPYRSLRFELKYDNIDSFQKYPVVAYPQAEGFVRIIEYKKLPIQNVKGTTYELEYSIPYQFGSKNEPYYPVLTENSIELFNQYSKLAESVRNLYVCGRLGDYKYYNMDQALERALNLARLF